MPLLRYTKISILLIFNVLFLIAIYVYFTHSYENSFPIEETRENGNYTFINPLLECNVSFKYYDPSDLVSKLENFVTSQKELGKVTDVAYYFRLLKNGSTFGRNETDKFIPASLIKLPLAIAYFKFKETNKDLLNKKILIDKLNFTPPIRNFGQDNVKIGQTYTIYELIAEMLSNSDNIAANLLFEYIGYDKLYQVYKELGLKEINFLHSDTIKISVKDYSTFFRILYNSSYLDRKSSENILRILSTGKFDIGLKGLLPKNIVVANKFGERLNTDTQEKQIHDCGIVYVKNNPYLLCVMTKGKNFDDLIYVIQHISKIVFDNISMKEE